MPQLCYTRDLFQCRGRGHRKTQKATLPPLLASTGHFCTEAGPPPGELTCSKGGPSMRAPGTAARRRGLVSAAGTVTHAPGKGQPVSGTGTPRARAPPGRTPGLSQSTSVAGRHQKRVQEGCLPQSVKYRLQGGDEERPREAGGCKPSLSPGWGPTGPREVTGAGAPKGGCTGTGNGRVRGQC